MAIALSLLTAVYVGSALIPAGHPTPIADAMLWAVAAFCGLNAIIFGLKP